MDQTLVNLGVGGALALLVIREVLTFLKNRSLAGQRTAGDQSPEFWQAEQRRAVTDVVVNVVVPILTRQNSILNELKNAQQEMNGQTIRILTLIEERLGKRS